MHLQKKYLHKNLRIHININKYGIARITQKISNYNYIINNEEAVEVIEKNRDVIYIVGKEYEVFINKLQEIGCTKTQYGDYYIMTKSTN